MILHASAAAPECGGRSTRRSGGRPRGSSYRLWRARRVRLPAATAPPRRQDACNGLGGKALMGHGSGPTERVETPVTRYCCPSGGRPAVTYGRYARTTRMPLTSARCGLDAGSCAKRSTETASPKGRWNPDETALSASAMIPQCRAGAPSVLPLGAERDGASAKCQSTDRASAETGGT